MREVLATNLHHPCSEESFSDNPDEWKPHAGAATESQSSGSKEDMDLEDEEPDTIIMKRKRAVRNRRPTLKKAQKTERSEALSDLVLGWKKIKITSQPTGTMHISAKSTAIISCPPSSMVSTSSIHSCHATSTTITIHQATSTTPSATNQHDEPWPGVEPNDEPSFTFGGLPLDEEVEPQDPKLANKHWSITRVHEIYASPLHIKVSQQADANIGCHQVKNSSLPPHTIDHFTKVLLLAFKVANILYPWECPNNDDINGDLFLVVKGLVKWSISTWLHKFAVTAERALAVEFEKQHLFTLKEKAKFVQFLLWDVNNTSSKHHLFLLKLAYDHYERPIGMLITSIQAVHHILLYSTEGTFNLPCSKSGAFSKANWGNYNVVSQKGTVTSVKHASVFLKRIQNLKDQQ
ncbi:hypothetical protein BJV74DRAFT_797447 [Russula compacta]|nr:hypothetical protein BJV74DRAFT_797447 [Russula compacta]